MAGPETRSGNLPDRRGPAKSGSRADDSRGAETLLKGQDSGKRKGEGKGGQRSGGPVHDQTRWKSSLGSEVRH